MARAKYRHLLIAAEISRFSKYFSRVLQLRPLAHDNGSLLREIQVRDRKIIEKTEPLAEKFQPYTLILLNGSLNHEFDIEGILRDLWKRCDRTSRVSIVAYNPYLSFLYRILTKLGFREGGIPATFVTKTDIGNLAKLSGFEVVRIRPSGFFPFSFFGIGNLLNQVFAAITGLNSLCFVNIILLRPVKPCSAPPSLSVVIPARNERGNIENAMTRLTKFAPEMEIIFVEGHSDDGTWEEIERASEKYKNKFRIRCLRQKGKGKNDAVRLGFSVATGELMTILDADLTMPPELLHRFYDAYCAGYGDFINGSRLVYPMEGEAMRFLNHLGNVFFAKALSFVLGIRIGDSLCGTKLVSRSDYERFVMWRNDFGDFDPFGDFELIFPASVLGLGIVDVPIRYLARTYGQTNIHRFRHGLMLLKMTLVGLRRIRKGASP